MQNTDKLNQNQPTLCLNVGGALQVAVVAVTVTDLYELFICECVHTIVHNYIVHSTALIGYDNLPSYHPYRRVAKGGGVVAVGRPPPVIKGHANC